MMKKTKSTLMIVVSLLSLMGLVSCDSDHHGEAKNKYMVTKPWRETLDIKKEYVAQIRAVQHIELRAFEKGYLQSIYVDEGQMIKKDQEMFQIMPLIVRAEYQKAKAEFDLAQIEYKNTQSLAKRKVVSANELALAKAKLDRAKAELALAKTHLDLTTIKAPFDGIMDRFRVRLGSLVEEGELLTTLSDNSKMWVYFNVSEADYLTYMAQKNREDVVKVQLRLANGEIFNQEGKIDTIEADFNNETGNVAFRATFPNPEGLLRHGETGNILLEEPLENALVIPQKATFEVLDKKFVYVVNKENKLESRHIEVENEVDHLFAIKSGLKESDTVILEGLGKIKAGQEVEPDFKKPEEVKKGLELPVD